ncbi:MAG: 3-isopropylmalate dehydratase small subunit, partial [Bryobacterales bacterium]|nr:3-isopropylmalate dehydratase small subunit [Bryobacterales bacterium]
GVGAVIAVSFARIFYRNSINLGLPLLTSAEAPLNIEAGDELEIDLAAGIMRKAATNQEFRAAPLDVRAVELLNAGGLIPYLKRKYSE